MLYYLSDGIYLNWAVFMKSISHANVGHNDIKKAFVCAQKAFSRDIERTFKMFWVRIQILQHSCLFREKEDMAYVMKACRILLIMIVKYRRDCHDSCLGALQHVEDANLLFNGGKELK